MQTRLHDLRNIIFVLEHGPHHQANVIDRAQVVQALRAITRALRLIVEAVEILDKREDPL